MLAQQPLHPHRSQLALPLLFLILLLGACQPPTQPAPVELVISPTATIEPAPIKPTTVEPTVVDNITPAGDPTPVPPDAEGMIIQPPTTAESIVSTSSFRQDPTCSDTFVATALDHITMVPGGNTVQMFEANGGGVAINDLDGDGKLDIVLANHRDPNTILWNEGLDPARQLRFKTQRMEHGDSRGVTIVDVDGDGLLDIVFSRRVSAPNFWRNLGARQFEQVTLAGVTKPLYAIDWGDIDQDGDLDLVGGTYDAALLAQFGQEFLNSAKAGVYLYMQNSDSFSEQPLALNAQALALILVDFNNDQRLDIFVGNDFGVPDYAWQRNEPNALNPWQPIELPIMSHSSMSYAAADIDNNGTLELFTTDMKPYANDADTMAAWQPVIESMAATDLDTDPQIQANVLRESRFFDKAPELGIGASGWSWSGKFGDLDQDGFVDLYIVNGMIEATTFAHLPEHELLEKNQALRSNSGSGFFPAPEWNLGSVESGRGMSMADIDGDGDLDIVVNNLRGPAQFFENQLCLGSSLLIDLKWTDSPNPYALGTQLRLSTTDGQHYYRRVNAASGYLSGDPTQVHFGFANQARLAGIEVIWPDGARSIVTDLKPNTRVEITR